jgi:hypothetical protein
MQLTYADPKEIVMEAYVENLKVLLTLLEVSLVPKQIFLAICQTACLYRVVP